MMQPDPTCVTRLVDARATLHLLPYRGAAGGPAPVARVDPYHGVAPECRPDRPDLDALEVQGILTPVRRLLPLAMHACLAQSVPNCSSPLL